MMVASTVTSSTFLVAQKKLASTQNTRGRVAVSRPGRSTHSRKCVVVRAAGTLLQ